MKDAVKNAAVSTKNFVVKHKTAIAVTAAVVTTTVVVAKLRDAQVELRNDFLEERGLADDFANWITTENNI